VASQRPDPRDQPQLAAPAPTGQNGRNGMSAVDRAHGGPVPEATFPELIGRVINDVSDLADQQIELAKQEINEAKDEAISAIKRILIGAGVAAASALLLVIWAWTAFIWFFNWLGAFITIGPVTLAWLGWLLGLILPAIAAFIAYRAFIRAGINQATRIWPPLERTRATLKEDLEWLRHQRTRSAR
jgi:Putative Actinobacterial Holin-X, holin superfamily III